MFKKLKDKWNVNWWQFTLIFTTFALGGSLCARLGNLLLSIMITEDHAVYWIVYIPLISILWPICVILVSIPLGQYRFFVNYLKSIANKMGLF